MAQSISTLKDLIATSLFGRRIGFDVTDANGDNYLLGPKDLVRQVEDFSSTAAATAVCYGITRVLTSGSSQTSNNTLQSPPFAGLRKTFVQQSSSTGCQIFTVAGTSDYILPGSGTTAGTSDLAPRVINLRGSGATVELMALSTRHWMVISSTAIRTDVTFTTST